MTGIMNKSARILGTGLLVAALALSAASCGGGDKDADSYREGAVDDLYNSGMDMLLAQRFAAAYSTQASGDR